MAVSDKNKAAEKWQKSYFDVLGLCCSSEVPLIEKILKPLDGVKEISVIVPSRTLIVIHDNLLISQIDIVKVLNQARLEANVRVYGDPSYQKKWPSPFAIACGLLLLLSFLKYVYRPFQWLALGAVAVGVWPIALRGVAALRNLTLDTNILVLIAVIGTITLKDYLEAGSIVFLFTIAEWLESRAGHKATALMSSLMSIAPQKAVIAETGVVVDVNDVKVSTIVAAKAGEMIPIDGIVVEGNCEVDEKTLTGESFPVPKHKDSTVWAGTINLNGYISVKTTALAEDCVVARMAKLVEEAQNNQSRTQRFIDKCAKYYTPAVVLMSAGLAGVPAALRVHNQNHWFHLALVVLVSACPCALILSTPVATFCALSKAATTGLLIKGADYLEILAKIKIMAFDKTGTITRGEFAVTEFHSLHHDVSFNTLLYWVSSIESKSSHPMAAALVDYGQSHSIEARPECVEEFHNFPGEGIHGKIDGNDIYIGNRKIAKRARCITVPAFRGDGAKEGYTVGYVYNGATPIGIFKLSDACRSGALEAIKELKSLGIKSSMLTGDSHAAAMNAQAQLGHVIEVIHAELLPEDKARIIRSFKKEGPTAMIGDGLNDALALAMADIGISMGISGSALATETGQVILMSNDIRKIPKAVRIARKTHSKVIQNVILSISTKAAILSLAFAGHPLVWAAVLADVGTCLLVIFNSMLLLRGIHYNGGKCSNSSKASHTHIHGCNTHGCKSSDSSKCSSDSSKCSSKCKHSLISGGCCENNKCVDDSTDRHDGCVGVDGLGSAKHCGHAHNAASHGNHNYGCSSPSRLSSCKKTKCGKSAERQCSRVGDDGLHEENKLGGHEHCDESHGNKENNLQHCVTSSPDLEQQMTHHAHCHSRACCVKGRVQDISDEELGHAVETDCGHGAPGHQKAHSDCGRQAVFHGGLGSGHMHVCGSSLEKREIGGCCKSFRVECCGKHGYFGAGFGGGLSEIVTE